MRRTAQFARRAERGLIPFPVRKSNPSICLLCQRRRVAARTPQLFTPAIRAFSTAPIRYFPDPGVPATNEIEGNTVKYRPAQTWDGLEMVGGETEWPLDIEPEVFAAKFVKLDKDTLSRLLYQSVAFVLSDRETQNAPPTNESDRMTISYTAGDAAPQLSQGEPAGQDESWLQIPLHDSQFKFDVLKRFYQISGTRIRDNVLDEIRTTGELLDKAIAINHERPNQVALDLEEDEELTALPNVSLSRTRRTYVDQERDIGRLKVIVDTLTRKNLPVREKERLAR